MYYHCNNPVWNDVLKLVVPEEKLFNCHVRFMARHRTTRDVKDKPPFSVGYLPLTNPNGTVLSNENTEVSFFNFPKTDDESFYLKPDKCFISFNF